MVVAEEIGMGGRGSFDEVHVESIGIEESTVSEKIERSDDLCSGIEYQQHQ